MSDRRFLATVVKALADPAVALSYCQSRQIDAEGRTLDADYLTYVSDIGAERWRHPYVAEQKRYRYEDEAYRHRKKKKGFDLFDFFD